MMTTYLSQSSHQYEAAAANDEVMVRGGLKVKLSLHVDLDLLHVHVGNVHVESTGT